MLGGSPGYINLLDAMNAWQLVRELKQATGLSAATSFKHVSPAGAAVGLPLSDTLKRVYFVDDMELTPLATAYARARGADRMSSFGDWIALSNPLDVATAKLIKREVSDGVIAPGFDPEALEILKAKKDGKYNLVQIDPAFEPPVQEDRVVFGVHFEQKRNDVAITPAMFAKIVTAKKEFPDHAVRDLLVAQIALKYTQSNSVVFALDGQVIGVGAGQQSRVHCVRLAAAKADRWFLRQYPRVLGMKFRPGIKRADRDNAIDLYFEENLAPIELSAWRECFESVPSRMTSEEKRGWLGKLSGVSVASDAFFPFRDNIDRAAQTGVKYVVQPGGSVRDDVVIQSADEYGMVMAFTKTRLFHL